MKSSGFRDPGVFTLKKLRRDYDAIMEVVMGTVTGSVLQDGEILTLG